MIAFIDDIINKSSPETKLLFLGRDSYMFKKVIDLYDLSLIKEKKLNASYIYINRIISNQLTTKVLDNDVLSYISSQFKSEGIWGLVTVYGLNNTNFEDALIDWLNLKGLPKNVFIDPLISKEIIANHKLINCFYQSISNKKENAQKYLETHIGKTAKSTMFVDIGWKGTIYKQLSPQFTDISGCYLLGYAGEANKNIHALFSKHNKQASFLNILTEYRDLIEYFLSENVSNIIGINSYHQPIYLINAKANTSREVVQEAIFAYCHSKLTLPKKTVNLDQVINTVKQFFSNVPVEFHTAIGTIESDINIQGGSNITLLELLPATKNVSCIESHSKDLQSMIYQFLKLVKDLQNENKIVIYGSGSGADFVLPHIVEKCVCIVDINEKVHGNKLLNIPIVGIDVLTTFHGVVLVTVLGRKNQIMQTLSTFNVKSIFLEDHL